LSNVVDRRSEVARLRREPSPPTVTLTARASDAVLESAYAWVCEQRRRWPDSADVWSFRRDWLVEKDRLQAELRSGRFRFGLQKRVSRDNGEEIDLFLGYHLAPGRLTLAQATVERFLERAHRLYEQDRREPQGSLRSDAYIRRWCGWAGELGVASPALSAPTVEIHTRALPAGSRRLP